jgi:Tol biopolymer transport system component
LDHSDVVVASTHDFRQHAAHALLGMGAPSPDGERIAFVEYSSIGNAIWVTRLAGGTPVRLTHSMDPQETAPSWSPDGQWISFLAKIGAARRLLMRAHVGTMETPQVILTAGSEEATTWCCVPQWSPTGEWIAYVANGGVKLASPDGTQHRLLSPLTATALTWSADGSQIYAISTGSDRRARLSKIDVATGATNTVRTFEPDMAFTTPLNPGVRASLAPDGRSVLTTVQRTRSDIWMLEGFDRQASLFDRLRERLRRWW